MQELIDHLQQCAGKAATAQAGDIAALVALHVDLLSTPDFAVDSESGKPTAPPGLLGEIQRIADVVESVVLNDSEPGIDVIRDVSRQIDELQKLISSAAPPPPAPLPPPVTPAPPQPPATPPVAIVVPGPKSVAPKKPFVRVIGEERAISGKDRDLAIEFVGEATGHLDTAEASLLRLGEDPSDPEEINAVFRSFHTLKGISGFLEFKQIGALAHAAETLLELIRRGKLQLNGGLLDLVLETHDMMSRMVQGIEVAAKTMGSPARQEGLGDLLKRLDAAACGTDFAVAPQAAVVAAAGVAPSTAPAAKPANTGSTSAEGVVKVSLSRLDALINAVGELVISQAMVTQDLGGKALLGDQRLARNLSHLGKITRGLQELSMSMRMVPLTGVFQKMARLARDLSRNAGKEIEFVQIGGETELDRNVVEAISDPLVHMVRNCIDHGVEGPDDRVKAGKPRTGRVVLKACHQAGNVVVEISDDGRGLDKPRILKKAIAAGIVSEGDDLDEQQIFGLIFHPGLSTAETLTDISGRGVGMDVVRRNVEALRGRIEIHSTPGTGSSFTVRLPLTLAVIDGLIVRVGSQRYIIPITSIEQSIRPTAAELTTVQGKGELCLVRDRLLPIVRMHRLFNVQPRETDPTKALVVIVQEGPNRCCLLVDELVGQQQVVIKSVGKEIGTLQGIAGCAILGDGNVSLILDVAGIIHSSLK